LILSLFHIEVSKYKKKVINKINKSNRAEYIICLKCGFPIVPLNKFKIETHLVSVVGRFVCDIKCAVCEQKNRVDEARWEGYCLVYKERRENEF